MCGGRSKHNCGHVLHGSEHNKETHLLMLNQPGLLYLLQTLRNACACSCKSEVIDDLQCSIQTTLSQLPSIIRTLFHWMLGSIERSFSIFIKVLFPARKHVLHVFIATDVKRQSGTMISKQNQGDLCEFAFPCLCLQLVPIQRGL